MWCKSLFEATAKKLFTMTIDGNESEDEAMEEQDQTATADAGSLNM